jgi:hypothetical protein
LAYLNEDSWVSDFKLAEEFETTKAAFEACYKRGIKNAELVLVMGDEPSQQYDITLPVGL